MSAYMSKGRKTVFKIKNIVNILVFHKSPVEKLVGWARLTNLWTINPNTILTIAEVAVMAYWIPCSAYTSFNKVSQKDLISLLLND